MEISAAFKNIYAIGCGLSDGLGYGINTRVRLIISAVDEMKKLFKKLGLQTDSNDITGTIGDLILTCNSIESRNYKFGKLLAQFGVDESLEKVNSTVEGYHSLASIDYFEKRAKSKLKLAGFIKHIVSQDSPTAVKKTFDSFMTNGVFLEDGKNSAFRSRDFFFVKN